MISKRNWIRGIRLKPDNVAFEGKEGELKVELSSAKFQAYLGGASRNIVTEDQSQPITNKTIDLDNNTLSNIEADNFKAGVIDTDLTSVSASDDTLPSAKATKTYADSVGSTAASNLSTHAAKTTGTHGVSGAIVGTSDTQTLTNKTIDANTNTITNLTDLNIAAGGISASKVVSTALKAMATDGNGKLTPSITTNQELSYVSGVNSAIQPQLDNKADKTSTEAHIAAHNAVHGITGNVVGDDDIQTISNKTIIASAVNNSSISSPTKLEVKKDTKANLVSYAIGGATNGQIVFATDEKKMYQVVDSKLVSIGGSSGSLDTIFQLLADETITDWSTGNSALFVTTPPLAGTFTFNTTAPLQGSQDYKYTQASGSLNDFMLSPIQNVDTRFRGQQATLFFPYKYNGNNNDIQVIFFDVTNGGVIPSSVFLQASTNVGMFRTNITIPSTCAQIQVGFQTKVANSGKVLQFDSIQLSADSTLYASIANQTQSTYLFSGNTTTASGTAISGLPASSDGTGLYSYDSSTGIFTVLKPSTFNLNFGSRPSTASLVQASIYVDNAFVTAGANDAATSSTWASTSLSIKLNAAQTFKFVPSGASSAAHTVSVTATASNTNILTAPDTFSTDTAPLAYSSTYTLSTLANAPVGTFITFTAASGSSLRTQTTTAPTQTVADMNQNGILIYSRAFNTNSTAAQPACIAIQIGKGLKGVSLGLYKSTGKTTNGVLDFFVGDTGSSFGVMIKEYNEATGILLIEASRQISTNTSASFVFSDATTATSGYLVINASKNPALTGLNISAVAARYSSTSGQTIGTTATTLKFETKIADTHGAYNTATGQYTVAESGWYNLSAGFITNTVNIPTGLRIYVQIFVNGSAISDGRLIGVGQTISASVQTSTNYFLSRNDVVTVISASDVAIAMSTASVNHFSITKTSVG